jgi:hypothetical protein
MIQLCENWYLDADERQFILLNWDGGTRYDKQKKKDVKTNQKYYYYSDLSCAMKALFVHLVRQGIQRGDTLEHLNGVIQQTYELVKETSEKITPDVSQFAIHQK